MPSFQTMLIPLYTNLLRVSKGRGAHTLARWDSKLFMGERTIAISNRTQISIPSDPHFFGYLTKSHENHVSDALKLLCEEGDTVIDIGANIGYFTAYAADIVGYKGKVFCFEPEAQNFKYLDDNCHLLGKQGFACKASCLAISSASGTATLNIHRHSTYHTLNANHQLDNVEDQKIVHTISLDEWTEANSISHIHFLKIDTEGHEKDVLLGCRELFDREAIDYVLLECRSEHLSRFIDDFAQEFSLCQLVWDGEKWHQATLSEFDYKTECLLSKKIISPLIFEI